MVIYGIIYKAIYFSYLSLFETSIHFPSLVSECRHFLKQESIFCLFRSFRIAWEKLKVFAIFQFILWTKISTSSFKSSFKLILRCKFFTSSFKFFYKYLEVTNFDLKFIGAKTLPLPLPLPLSSFQGIKKGLGTLGTQSPNFSS